MTGTAQQDFDLLRGAIDGQPPAPRRMAAVRPRPRSAEVDRTAAQVALRWVLQQPGMTGPIIGARTLEQLAVKITDTPSGCRSPGNAYFEVGKHVPGHIRRGPPGSR